MVVYLTRCRSIVLLPSDKRVAGPDDLFKEFGTISENDFPLDYLVQRHGIQQTEPFIKPKMIVLHWTAIPTLEATFDVFNSSMLPGREDLQAASRLNTSVPFLVDRDGTIFRLLPDTTFARHCIGLNYCAIGIENIGNNDLTKAQIKANIQLVRYLKGHFKGIAAFP